MNRLLMVLLCSIYLLYGQTTTLRVQIDSLPDPNIQSTYFATASNNTNQTVISAGRRIVFSVWLKNTSATSIELSGGQLQFNFNKNILNGGSGTLNLIASSFPGVGPNSGMWLKNPTVYSASTPGQLRTAANTLPGAGSGLVIPPGDSVLWHTFKFVTSAYAFAQANLDLTIRTTANATAPQTKIGAYINSVNTQIESQTTYYYSNSPNAVPILPIIGIINPSSGHQWHTGNTYMVNWQNINLQGDVKLDISTNGGNNWLTLVNSTPATNKNHIFTMPPFANTNTAKLRVISIANPAIGDTSDGFFTIENSPAKTIRITEPNTQVYWDPQTTHAIRWSKTGDIANVGLEYSLDNGKNWQDIIETTAADSGQYLWNLPIGASNSCRIRIYDVDSSYLSDINDSIFSINDKLIVSSPLAGEVLQAGSTKQINWSYSTATTFEISYSTNNGSTWTTIASSVNSGLQNYNWTIPNISADQVKVKIRDQNNLSINAITGAFLVWKPEVVAKTAGSSYYQNLNFEAAKLKMEAYFIIGGNVTTTYFAYASPAVGNLPGNIVSISNFYWSVSASGLSFFNSKVATALTSLRGFSDVTKLVWLHRGTSGGNWTNLGGVVINDSLKSLIEFTEPGEFAIGTSIAETEAITLLSPNGNEHWKAGTVHPISWISSGIQLVNIYFSSNGGSTWQNLASNLPANSGNYSWSTPSDSSQYCRIKITDASNSSRYDMSYSNFKLYHPLVISSTKFINLSSNTLSFDSALISMNFSLKSSGSIQVDFYPYESPMSGTMPTGIQKVSNYYWHIQATQVNVMNVSLRIHIRNLRGVANSGTLYWLKRSETGGAWTNIGGSVIDSELVSTVLFGSFSEFAIGTTDSVNNPLPVELSSFSAHISNRKVILNWQTASENNNNGFDIERAEMQGDNLIWKRIGFVVGAGNTNTLHDYSYTDAMVQYGKYYYRLKQIDNDGTFNYSKIILTDMGIPQAYSLEQNYPNPFNPTTKITFTIPEKSIVELKIFNQLGERVALLLKGEYEAGQHSVDWSGAGMPSGIYLYELQVGKYRLVKKLMLMK